MVMALTTSRITELPLRSTPRSASLRTIIRPSHSSCPSSGPPRRRLRPRLFSSIVTTVGFSPDPNQESARGKCSGSPHSSPWLNNWTPDTHVARRDCPRRAAVHDTHAEPSYEGYVGNERNGESKGQKAIERIVLRLRNLGLGLDDDDDDDDDDVEVGSGHEEGSGARTSEMSDIGEEKLSDLLRREWIRPDSYIIEREVLGRGGDDMVLPWEREGKERGDAAGSSGSDERGTKKGRSVKAPTLAELTIEDEELRRLRRDGMYLRERINVAQAGITKEVLEKIHDRWRKAELVRLKFHEVLATDMKTAHEIVEVGRFKFKLILL